MGVQWWLATVAALPMFAALPPGVTEKPVPGHSDIRVFERLVTPAALPSFWDSFFKLFGLPSGTKADLPFGRSVGVLVGVGHYAYITPKFEYVSKDVEKLRDYLLGNGGFDAVYVMDESVSPGVVNTFMTDEIRQVLKPNDRLLFYYSGHGADPGSGRPVLQFQKARPGQWGHDVLRVDEFEQWSGILKNKHLLFLYDACTAGQATERKGGTEAGAAVSEVSGNGSRIVVTAGTAQQQAWVVKESSDKQYSIFTEALVRVLRDGTAESKTRGFMTIGQAVEEAAVILAETTRHLGPGHEMRPDLVRIDGSRTGTFVFLNPHAQRPVLAQSDILTMAISLPKGEGGGDINKEMQLAEWKSIESLEDPQIYTQFCEKYPGTLLCAAARKRIQIIDAKKLVAPSPVTLAKDLTKLTLDELNSLAGRGSRDAVTQLGRTYESGLQGALKDLPISMDFYRKASDLGDAEASYRLGVIYAFGREGVPKDGTQAFNWHRKAAEAGHASGMTNLGLMYESRCDDTQAVIWYRKAAEAGDALGMANLGKMSEGGRGGLPKDDTQAVIWYRKAVEAGDALGMANLGKMYEGGRGGLPKDDTQAVVWYRKAVEAGDASGMTNLGLMYEFGRGGLLQGDTQAVNWYRKAAEAGDASGMSNLGKMYESGRGGLPKDHDQAATWSWRAALIMGISRNLC